jgi:hypothetical protein
LGLEGTVGAADRRVSALPALRGIATPAALGPFPSPVRLEVDSYRPAVVDEAIEIRLGFDGATGRLAIADGDARHEVREGAAATAATWLDPTIEIPPDPTAALGSRVDLVA